MATHFEMLSPDDRPALVALTTADLRAAAQAALANMGYRVHTTEAHEDFLRRFTQFQYQVVVLEDRFPAAGGRAGQTLQTLQGMPMALRRSATILVLGANYRTLDAMEAFAASVHAVVNTGDLVTFPAILQKVISDNELFLSILRDAQARQAHGG